MCLRRSKAHVPDESQKAVEDATQHIRAIQARGPEVHELAESMRDIRRRNHFAEQLMTMMSLPMEGGKI